MQVTFATTPPESRTTLCGRLLPHVLRRFAALHAPGMPEQVPLSLWRTGGRCAVGDTGRLHLRLDGQAFLVRSPPPYLPCTLLGSS